MADSQRLLELIEQAVVEHGGDLGGWTQLTDDSLKLFDGQVTLRAHLEDDEPSREGMIHGHVSATLHEHDDEVLEACLFGMGENREAALRQAAGIWLMSVAGPIKSFMMDKPVCMTSQAGVAGGDSSEGYSPNTYGLATGLRAYVGPLICRGLEGQDVGATDDTLPWFRFAAESAAPRRVHLAKVTLSYLGSDGWRRELEIDGHDVSHVDLDWPAAHPKARAGYATRFVVFEFPRNSTEIARRLELEKTIRYFAENYSKHGNVNELQQAMVEKGFDPDLAHEVESISTFAFGRAFFEPHGFQFPATIIRALRDGRVETDVPLMSLPAYSRARALAVQLRKSMPKEEFESLCFYSAESNCLLKAMEASDKQLNPADMKMYPCVVPDRGVSDETFEAAFAKLQELIDRSRTASKKKPWWKFW